MGDDDEAALQQRGPKLHSRRTQKGFHLWGDWAGPAGLLHEPAYGHAGGIYLVDRLPGYCRFAVGNRGLTQWI